MWKQWADAELNAIREADRFRSLVTFDGNGVEARLHDRPVIVFSSNDYLGLSQHPKVRQAACEAIERFGTSATAARLVVGTRSLHTELEAAIATWKHCEQALVFPNGYTANLGVLTAFASADVTIFSDQLNHASIIDGCRLSKAQTKIYRHVDMDDLGARLRATPGRKIVVTDSVFSMDGDEAPFDALTSLCGSHDALLIVDEAHSVLGPHIPDDRCELLRVGTLSKTFGAMGGWAAGPRALIELLINRARTFIFTTGLSPADAAAAMAALEIFTSEEGDTLRSRLRHAVDFIAPGHVSQIVPVILGEDRAALLAAAQMLQQGLLVPAIRPPTVPPGTARLRIALSAAHTQPMLERLRQVLATLKLP